MRLLRSLAVVVAAVALLAHVGTASPSSSIRYGIQDDAWLAYGPGTIAQRAARLHQLGVSIVRYTLAWNEIAATRPANPRSPRDPAYKWLRSDAVLAALRAHGILPLVTLTGTPAWANGGRSPSFAPLNAESFADFASAAATRYPWVRRWLIWSEPNQRRWLVPTSPRVYVQRLLNPAYAAIHAAVPKALVGGGVTAPRGGPAGVSPVDFIRGMAAAHARLDAYAHHPYPLSPSETPWSGGCDHCKTITMATLPRLLREVQLAFGPKRIWLTEYGYQTNPPDDFLGVSYARQAQYLADASLRAYLAPRVDILIQYLVVDEPDPARWQSGLFTINGRPKPSLRTFSLPFSQLSRHGASAVLWGQVRPGVGQRSFRLQIYRAGAWHWLGATQRTDANGFFRVTLAVPPRTRLRFWSSALRLTSGTLAVA